MLDAEFQLSATGEHPFYVLEKEDFIPVDELEIGFTVSLADGNTAHIRDIQTEEAPDGETFTTYNFEVDDFHTYFAGEPGVWVHNTGKSPCDEVFSYFRQILDNDAAFYGKPWGAFANTAENMGAGRNKAIFGWAADEVMRKDLKDLPLADRIAQWPSHTQVKETMSNIPGVNATTDLNGVVNYGKIDVPDWVIQDRVDLAQVKAFTLESHHGVPKKIQEWLGVTKDRDSVPAYLTTMLEHRGAEYGIHQRLSKKLGEKIGVDRVPLNRDRPAGLEDDDIIDAMREVYEEAGLSHFWQVCDNWLTTP